MVDFTVDGVHGVSRREFVRTTLGLVATPLLVGCRSPTSAPPARLMARPGVPTVAPTRGLTSLGLGTDRDGLLYVPDSYDPGTPAPLFVALHGAGGSGQAWPSYYARAESRRMIFMAPSSRASTWDLIRGELGPDVSFIDKALAHTFARCRIDPAHVCLGGFSDGASYALALGLGNGDLFSHLVSYSAGFLAEPEKAVGKPRVFLSHGIADPVLPVRTSRDVIAPQLTSEGYDVTYKEFEGVHQVPSDISDAALDWFLAR